MTDQAKFSGYKWQGLLAFPEGSSWYSSARSFLDRIDWEALCQYASKLHGKTCTLDSQITMGGHHMVRLINFEDGSRWIARLRMTGEEPESTSIPCPGKLGLRSPEVYPKTETLPGHGIFLQREVDCIRLVKEQTSVPVLAVLSSVANPKNKIGAPFMLMECLAGNSAIEMNSSSSAIPDRYKIAFYKDMARFQTEISNITFPKIGTITRLPDGTYDIGPLPGIGGPFNTATEYLKAWAQTVKFSETTLSRLDEFCGGKRDSEDTAASILEFPHRLGKIAANIPVRDHGPFPLYHPDFGHQNMIVDDSYNILGVINWEHAHSMPWEAIVFPFTLTVGGGPAPMYPRFWDENVVPKSEETRLRLAERKQYVHSVREMEREKNFSTSLSDVLCDEAGQDLAQAMEIYLDGKPGRFCKVLDVHQKRWSTPQVQVGRHEG